MRLISGRCSKLIPILSPNFFSSESNNFFTLFAQHIGITEEKRKIIPIIYQDCLIPPNLGIYHKLQAHQYGVANKCSWFVRFF
jgi:myeloid differentiation primary response protein MyD88